MTRTCVGDSVHPTIRWEWTLFLPLRVGGNLFLALSGIPPTCCAFSPLFVHPVLQSTTRVKPFICTMPMRLDEGWNQIQFNLSDFTRRAYGTNYIETLRVQIHANCRVRRIYFSDRLYSEEELPPEFKLFLPVQK